VKRAASGPTQAQLRTTEALQRNSGLRNEAKHVLASLIPPPKACDPAEAHRVSTQLELLFLFVGGMARSEPLRSNALPLWTTE